MARARKAANSNGVKATDYRHPGEKRPNIPPAKIEAEGKVPSVPKVRYYYNPHLPPVLRFDPTGEADRVKELVYESAKRPLSPEEVTKVAEAVEHYGPWLEWAGKREQHEKGYFEVDPVALHIHERVSAQAIVRAAMREDVQRDLFADPQQPYQQAIQFYKHDVDWANRLILGDSLQVMSSLARRENLAGKVQMIYMDPPYGIHFSSNFQSQIGQREVKDHDRDLSREPETVKAYRDAWTLGVHSYLTYLRDRFVVCRELLSESGSIFVQIGEDNVHLVRRLLEEVFGVENYLITILLKKKGGQKSGTIDPINDYILWTTKDKKAATAKFRPLFSKSVLDRDYLSLFSLLELPDGQVLSVAQASVGRRVDYKLNPERLLVDFPGARLFTSGDATIGGIRKNQSVLFRHQGRDFDPGISKGTCWKHTAVDEQTGISGMARLAESNRLMVGDSQVRIKRYADDFGASEVSNWWDEFGGAMDRVYVVQTNPRVVERCMLLCTDPGDLVLDPTCGSGTTAYVAESWGRRWITVDTSRVALALARQRLLIAKFDYYRLKDRELGPSKGFQYESQAHVTSSVVANCLHLDPIFAKHEPILAEKRERLNREVAKVGAQLKEKLVEKLIRKHREESANTVTDADARRWLLPDTAKVLIKVFPAKSPLKGVTPKQVEAYRASIPKVEWKEWEVPFDVDPDWPKPLQDALIAYRAAWRAKMDEVNKCIADNAEQEELVNKPDIVNGILRVSGPFTVEGVRPEELSLSQDGLVDATPTESEEVEVKNISAYLIRMVQHLRADGLTFIGNQGKKFARLEPLFETQTGSIVHAEGVWEGGDLNGPNSVAVGFGPQYGPVTALQVRELIDATKRYDELVVAGFSFDAEATEVIQDENGPKLRIHQAYIRPDINPAMEGLLKDTPNSQLFTVFGQPEVEVQPTEDGEWVVKLVGVDIYDPIENTIRSSGAEKVAAWFLDSEYDGRCFCITQAFFPDQDAWEKIAKALGSSADPEAFEKFAGTESLPFKAGKYKRIAVKVIDPRGNEVMAVRQLET